MAPLQTILNVDDASVARHARGRTLTQAGYRVVDATTGDEALLIVRALRPQLVIVDLNLRDMSAPDLCKRIKSEVESSHTMVLHVASFPGGGLDAAAGLDSAADGYLIEPIDPLELIATVRALLRLSERQTENRRLSEQLSRLGRQFAEATDAADCGLWNWDIRTGRLEWLGQTERLAGLLPGSFSGKIEAFTEVLHPDDRTRVWNKLHALMSGRETHFDDEHRYVHPDGSVHWMSAIGRFFYNEQGTAVRMTGVVQDITTRKLAELRQQLESERRRLLARAAEQLLLTDNPEALMAGVFETVRQHLDLDGYFHYRVTGTAGMLALAACAGVPDEILSRFAQLPVGQALCGMTVSAREPVIYERLHESSDPKAAMLKALGFHACACHPLMIGDRLMGTLSFASHSRDRFDADEMAFMQSIGRYVAAAMERLRLEAETKERADRLREGAEHLRAAMELNPQIPWTALPNGWIEDFNERWLTLTGLTRAEAQGDSWKLVQHEEDLPRMIEAWEHSLVTGEPLDIEHRIRLVSGDHRWMRSRAFPLRDGNRILRWYGTTEDIHDRKLAETALNESRERLTGTLQFFEAVMANIQEGLYTLSHEGIVTYVNPAAERLLGWTSQELLGKRMHDIIHYRHRDGTAFPADCCMGLEVLRKGQPLVEHADVFIRKDGTFFDVVYTSAPMWSDDTVTGVVFMFRDVTDKQKAERALLGSEERFRTMAQAVPSFLFETNSEGWNTWTSDGWCRFTGQTQEQVKGHGWAEALHPEDRAANIDQWTRCMREGLPFEARQRLRRHDGYYAWVIAKALPVRNQQGTIDRWLGSVTNVDELIRGEEALRESEERFRQIVEMTDYVFWVMQLNPERVLYASPAVERVWQRPASAFYENPRLWSDAIYPEEQARVRQAFEQWLANPAEKNFDVEYRIVRPDGTIRWIADRGHVIRDAQGHVYRLTGIARDVTDVKTAEGALRRSEEQLRVITDAVPSFIAYVDDHERYRFVNAEYEKWFHRPRHDIVGLSIRELLGEEGYPISEPFIRRVLAGEAVTFERDIHYGGTQRTVQNSYTPDMRENGTVAGFYVLVTDITERKRQEDELRRWKDELEVRVDARTRELVSSQLRLRELASQLSLTEQHERRKLAIDLHDYLAQLLVVGRMKVSRLKNEPALHAATRTKVEDIDTVFQQALHYTRTMIAELCPPTLHESGLPMALQWLGERMQKDGLWVEVTVNREEVALPVDRAVFLFQSVRELLFNVLKHAGVDRATVTLTAGEDGSVSVSVIDRGKGLSVDAMQRAAQPGHLGLFSVRERMEAMGGRVDVTSTPGLGTTVTIVLPGVR